MDPVRKFKLLLDTEHMIFQGEGNLRLSLVSVLDQVRREIDRGHFSGIISLPNGGVESNSQITIGYFQLGYDESSATEDKLKIARFVQKRR